MTDDGTWALSKLTRGEETLLVRLRTDLTAVVGDPALPHLLTVEWHGAFDKDAMSALEDMLVDALEGERLALLAVVITALDQGTRTWLWYYGDRDAVEARVNEALSSDTPYPIDLTSESDPAWECFTNMLRDAGLQP